MNKLKRLANKYGSDKSSRKHDYTEVYTELFEPIRNKKLNILELGVDKGASILMWLDYFPNSRIIGVDIGDPPGIGQVARTNNLNLNVRCIYIKCDQINFETFETFDIVIDDCSHITEYTIYSYMSLISRVKPGGLYIIEDSSARIAKYTNEILGKYGEIRNVGKDSMIIIRKDN